MNLTAYADRYPKQLSGGPHQRVALARALVYDPPILLMDEPLGALDKKLPEWLQLELGRIHRELGSTFIYVTHDQEEALVLSDRIAVFNKERIEQIGSIRELYDDPQTFFVGRFIGESTVFMPNVSGSTMEASRHQLAVEGSSVSSKAAVLIRPENWAVSAMEGEGLTPGAVNRVPGTVKDMVYLGLARRYSVVTELGEAAVRVRESAVGPGRLIVRVTLFGKRWKRMHFDSSFVNGSVSHWFRDVGYPKPRQELQNDIAVDVAIVGGGLTGLWCAYYLLKSRPDLNIAIIEREFVGFGASGRNGGWLSGLLPGLFRHYSRTHGHASAVSFQRHMLAAVDEAVGVASLHDIEADIKKGGLISVALNPAQLRRVREDMATMLGQGWAPDDLQELTAGEVSERISIAGALGGYWTRHAARIHPAKFVQGLATTVEGLGAQIYEQTTAHSIAPGKVNTDHGTIQAKHTVSALEGYTDSLEGEQRRMLPMNSSMIVTQQLPDSVWSEIGWNRAELLSDMAHSFAYVQKTADGRIALGGRGVPYNFASSFDQRGSTALKTIGQLIQKLDSMFPALADYAVEHTWTGVLGVPRDWSASINFDRDSRNIRIGGYVGHGVTATNLAGQTARDLIFGEATERTSLPWVGHRSRRWEIEPIRWLGAQAIYASYRQSDRLEEKSQSVSTSLVARGAALISGRY